MEQDIYHALFYNLNPSTFATHHFDILFIFLLLTLISCSKYAVYFHVVTKKECGFWKCNTGETCIVL